MKDLTYKFKPAKVIRVINKFTLDYVEIIPPIGAGQDWSNITDLINVLLPSSLGYNLMSGSSNPLINIDDIPKFHYYCIYDTDKDNNQGICHIHSGLFKLNLIVDLTTNKFTKGTIDHLIEKGYTETSVYKSIDMFGHNEYEKSDEFFKQTKEEVDANHKKFDEYFKSII